MLTNGAPAPGGCYQEAKLSSPQPESAADSQPVDTLRVVVADDHPLLRSGIRIALERVRDLVVVGEAGTGDEALQVVLQTKPELLILDVSMPGLPPDQVILQARSAIPQLKTLILTAYDDEVYVRRLSEVQISGYLLKDEAPENLAQAVRVIQQGATWFSKSIATKMMGFSRTKLDPFTAFNARELEVLTRIAEGVENRLIASDLNLAPQTVRNYVRILYQKINVTSRAQAVVWAREHGLNRKTSY